MDGCSLREEGFEPSFTYFNEQYVWEMCRSPMNIKYRIWVILSAKYNLGTAVCVSIRTYVVYTQKYENSGDSHFPWQLKKMYKNYKERWHGKNFGIKSDQLGFA